MRAEKTILMNLVILAGTISGLKCPSYSYVNKWPAWKDISNGQEFHGVAGNSESKTAWATLKFKHYSGNGYAIA
jgi:hypothetical protein